MPSHSTINVTVEATTVDPDGDGQVARHRQFLPHARPTTPSLVDADQLNQWTADWSRWLVNLVDEGNVEVVTMTVHTIPAPGDR